MTGQWKQLADSGLPLKDCLRFLIRSQSDPTNKFKLHNALRHLESGNSLQDSFQIAQGFPDLFTQLLAVAENSDQLPTILRALRQLYVLQEQERQERWQLLRYPLTIAGFALAIFLQQSFCWFPYFVDFILPKEMNFFGSLLLFLNLVTACDYSLFPGLRACSPLL